MTPWWKTDGYGGSFGIPFDFNNYAGPRGIALVRAWPNNSTDSGWGLMGKNGAPGFMENYKNNKFNELMILKGFTANLWNFAFVMRSMAMVCIDIDGKNGGFEGVLKLGALPHTSAEVSKSGNGYHLFYSTPSDAWDSEEGFGGFRDRIAIQQGVDIRGTGCVFHHAKQRWNNRPVVPLPKHLQDVLNGRKEKEAAQIAQIMELLKSPDPTDLLIMQTNLVEDLSKPIPEGRRNSTLFAIGAQMFLARVPGWEKHVQKRADDLGLEDREIDKLITNIKKYTKEPA